MLIELPTSHRGVTWIHMALRNSPPTNWAPYVMVPRWTPMTDPYVCHINGVPFTINIPPMLAYIPYMDPMGTWTVGQFGITTVNPEKKKPGTRQALRAQIEARRLHQPRPVPWPVAESFLRRWSFFGVDETWWNHAKIVGLTNINGIFFDGAKNCWAK